MGEGELARSLPIPISDHEENCCPSYSCTISYYRLKKGSDMRSTITISVPEQLKSELEKVSRANGVSRSDIVRESIRDYLFVHRFRSMRRSMVSKASASGVYTDQDVFDRVS